MPSDNKTDNTSNQTQSFPKRVLSTVIENAKINTCIICKTKHAIYNCVNFTKLSIQERISFKNCLSVGHKP